MGVVKYSGNPTASRNVQPEGTALAPATGRLPTTHGVAQIGQTLGQRADGIVVEDYGLGTAVSPYDPKFHQGLIVASAVESDRHVFGPVLVEEEQAAEQHPLGIERGIDRPVGTDGSFELLHPLLPSSTNRSSVGSEGTFKSRNHRRVTSATDALVQFIGLQTKSAV